MSRSASSDWLPLGGAQIIDWSHLGLAAPGRGAAAWAGRVDGEPVLVRAFSSENTTTFDFVFLAYEELTGQVVVITDRSAPARLRLEVSVEVSERLSYTDALELTENPRTGLHGATVRAVDVRQGPSLDDLVQPPTPADAEMLEYAPESALHTACGVWLGSVLSAVKARLLDGVAPSEVAQAVPADDGAYGEPEPAYEPEPEPEVAYEEPEPAYEPEPEPDYEPEPAYEPEPEPEPRRAPKPAGRRPRETIDAPSPRRARTPEPPPPEPEPDVPDKLVASTNTGDSWEVVDQETFIGRSKQCAIVLKSQRVSRRHASVTIDDDGYYINDLGAANGIWAGTEKIERERIEDGAEYIIGDVLMTFSFA